MIVDEKLKLGVVAAALSPDVRSVPALARKAGFSGVLFDAMTPAFDITSLSGTGRREFVHLLSAQAQQVVGLRHTIGGKGFGVGADVDHILSTLQRILLAAKDLAAPRVCLDVGPMPSPQVTQPPKPKVTPEMAGLILLPDFSGRSAPEPQPAASPAPDPAVISLVDAGMIELGRLADRMGVVIAMRSELSSLAAIERALKAADCPWFGVDLDPAGVLADEWDLDETFARLGGLVRHVRARDARGGAERRTMPAVIGEGDTDWTHLLSNLRDADYRGWITVDSLELPDRVGASALAAAYLSSRMAG